MTTELYLHCFIACLIGNVLHVAVKINSLSTDYKKANLPFSIKEYFIMDKWPLLLDVIGSFCLVYIVDEWLSVDARIMNKIKTIFIVIGFTGSYVILHLSSVAKSRFRKAIDEKTNIADGINKPTDTK